MLHPISNADRRDAERFDIYFRTVLIESDVFGEQVQIINIARMGFLARTKLTYETGAEISLHLPHIGQIGAMVVWCNDDLLGGRFHDAIDEPRFHDFLEALP